MTGQILGHYRILEQIGAGGMGIVYRARDEQLERYVALKVLSDGALANETARARFRTEALALSQLNHPNICTIYEIGEAGGQTYIAMELVEGRPLSEQIPAEGLPIETAIRYGGQIAAALAHAHERGVLHRDLKNSNVVITTEGRAKVLDFGLAKRLLEATSEATRTQTSLTEAGTVLGTLRYMAPEVLHGQPADARSDIWALGVMLYEMAAGQSPFHGQTGFDLTSSILRDTSAPLPPRVPSGLRNIIQRCLAKQPGERYQRAGEAQAALETAQSDTHSVAAVVPKVAPPRRWAILLASGLALVLLALLIRRPWTASDGKAGPQAIRSIAVLPLDNLSRDPGQEYFTDGMTEQLIASLSKIGAVRVTSRTSIMQYKSARKPLPEIARELKADAVVEGSVLHSGNRVRITVQLIRAATDEHLWAESYERDLQDILTLQGEVARTIASQIRVTLTPSEQQRLAASRRVDPQVHELYLKGEYESNKASEDDVRKGIRFFEQAIQRDSTYALPYAGLALAYGRLSSFYMHPKEAMPKAKAAAETAIRLDETLSEAHTALVQVKMYFEWDWAGAENELKRALELNPSSADAHILYGAYLTALGRHEKALKERQRALELDPLSLFAQFEYQWSLMLAHKYDQVIEETKKTLAAEPKAGTAYANLGLAYIQKGRVEDGITALQKASELESSPMMTLFLAHGYAVAGNKQESERLLQTMIDLAKRRYVCSYEIATVYASLGQKDQAFEWFRRAVAEGSDCMVWLKFEPWLDTIRSDPRFAQLLRQVGL